jgi:ubiquitin
MRVSIFHLLIPLVFSLTGCTQNKYVGVRVCKACHQAKEDGRQYEIWRNSKHAGAFKTLTTSRANKIAKEKGLTKPAAESHECLQCHTIVADEKLKEDGVQCESCHGAGSVYKSRKIMEDRSKAVAAGMTDFKDEEAIEKSCLSCHNKKSPTLGYFDFKSMWEKIKHPVPEK